MSQNLDHKVTHILLKDLVTSPTQPRKAFDLAPLQELASSIEAHGILQPLLVRSLGTDGFEVVDGERRWRAAELAELKSVPCLVKELGDEEVVQIQVVQAIHRAELTPLEEAQAYKRLLDGGMPLDDLVAKVGKSKAYIYHRSRLLALAPEVQEALAGGELKLAYAEAFARVPDHHRQLQLLPLALKMGSLESLQELIEERFLLQLAHAPFNTKDADLHEAAGACTACPKRTGAQDDLFGAAGKTDTCLDSACWNAKCEAQQAQVVAKAERKGEPVLTGKQGAKVLKGIQEHEWRPGKYAEAKLKPEWLKAGTLGEALKGTDVKPLQVFDPSSGKIRQVYDLEAAQAAIPAKLKRAGDGRRQEKALTPEQQAKEAHKRRVEHVAGQLLDRDAMKAVWEALRKKPASTATLQAAQRVMSSRIWHQQDVLAEVLGQKKLDAKKAANTPQAGVALLVVTAMHLSDDGPESGEMPDLLKAVGVDVKALKKKALAEAEEHVTEEEQSAAKAAAVAKAKDAAPSSDEEPVDMDDEDLDDENVPKKKRK
jgi:ParB/RepB/Spo0J family partition protein